MTALIEARSLRKSYEGSVALDGVDFTIDEGRIVGLIGPNGAGKTTALKAILGLTPYEGHLRVLGYDPHRQRKELMEQVCFIADVAVLPRWMRVSDAVDFMEAVHPNFKRARALEFLSRTKVRPEHKVRQLSKGMIVQLHLSLVMAIEAKLLVLDEPTLGLDILYRKDFYAALLADYFDEGRTIIVTTHQVEEIEHILTDVMFIKDGRIILDDTMDTVSERYVELLASRERSEEIRALNPLAEREVFGKCLFLFQDPDRDRLRELGELHTPSITDLFVAKMRGDTA
jgi:ABC-2 type transport system ATP-binding protein